MQNSRKTDPGYVFDNCIVKSPMKLRFLSFMEQSKMMTVTIDRNSIHLGETTIPKNQIVEILILRPDKVVTKSNLGVYIKTDETYYFFFVKGLQYFPKRSETEKLIGVIEDFYESKIKK